MDKQNFRQKMRTLRKTLALSETDKSNLIAHLKAILTNTPKIKTIALYEKMGGEIDPACLVEFFTQKGLHCVFPEIIDNNKMKFSTAPDLIIVPLLAFDREGHRLGQGGGYYDRYLEHSKALHIGLAYAEQEIEKIPAEPHDQKLHWILTPKEAIKTA
jgi:5-formyltetrahydrofolate cyclo-ligase